MKEELKYRKSEEEERKLIEDFKQAQKKKK